MTFSIILLTLAGILGLAAWIWLIAVAFQNQEKNWGILLIVSMFLPIAPIVGPLFLILRWSIAKRPGIVLLTSIGLTVVGGILFASAARKAVEELAQNARIEITDDTGRRVTLRPAATDGGTPEVEEETVPSPEKPASPPPPPPRPTPRSGAGSVSRPTPAARSVPVARPEQVASTEPGTAPGETVTLAVTSATDAPATAVDQALDSRYSPVKVEFLTIGEPTPNRIRQVRARARNDSSKPVRELKLELTYVDHRGLHLGRWTTVHLGNGVLTQARSTNEFDLQAFFVPQFTRLVEFNVAAVAFEDGTRWPEVDSTLGTSTAGHRP